MRHLLACVVFVAACGAENKGTGDDAGGDACTGDGMRCTGMQHEQCIDGTWHVLETCQIACTEAMGCVACDPNAGALSCSGNDVVTCNADGTLGPVQTSCPDGTMCQGGACKNSCTADGVDLVYVVDEANHFMSFDPRLLPGNPFTIIGTLSCPTTGSSIQVPAGAVMPFSMSVDRDGKAWVEYTSGEIFNVSLQTAACTASGYTARAGGMDLFGMGFVSDAAGSDQEKLFIAGGGRSAEPNGKLATVDTHAMMYTPAQVGMLTEPSDFSAELTGTGAAQLYGFFPVTSGGNAYVQEIDKTTGGPIGTKHDLGPLGTVRDWAFAQWGNKFYVFTTVQSGSTLVSTVKSIDKATGMVTTEVDNSPYQVDGAGVSTCAPSVLQ